MDYQTATSRKLHGEHRDALALLGRLERGVLGVPAGGLPDADFAALAKQVARSVEGEVDRHFRFEEDELFHRLAAAGEHDLVDLLQEEHRSIRASAAELLPMLQAASAGGLDAAQLAALKPAALEFAERLESHIHKEDAALLPAIDAILDAAVDQQLALACAEP